MGKSDMRGSFWAVLHVRQVVSQRCYVLWSHCLKHPAEIPGAGEAYTLVIE